MGSEINISETIEDKKSWFNIKRFKIGNDDFQKPEKSLDVKSLDQATFRNLKSEFKFFEATKIVKNYRTLLRLYNEDDEKNVNSFFYKREWLAGVANVVNFTFEFNPFSYVKSIDDLSWFFDKYYPYSKAFLTVPNIRLTRRVRSATFQIIELDSYIRFVDAAFKILDDKNAKQVFVPVSMRMGIGKLTKLIEHYLKEGYYNYWFDFEGQSISEHSLGSLRHVFKLLKKHEDFTRVVSYFTNVKREKLSNSNEVTSVASDALCAVAGANLIGINREPQRYFELSTSEKTSNVSVKKDATIRTATPVEASHKARIFDRDTYYYVKTKDAGLYPKNKYVPVNAAKLNAEFRTQSEYFLQNQNIDTLLDKKTMFKDPKAGRMLEFLTSRKEETKQEVSEPIDLTDYMDEQG